MSKLNHIPVLDGLRGLAALLVLLFHTTFLDPSGLLDDTVFRATRGFSTGVDIFFVLSGFLITAILIRSRDEQFYFRNFYVKRLLRIFPLYYLLIAVSLFAPMAFPFLQQNDLPLLPYWGANYWLFLSNVWNFGPHPILGVSWSLAYEEQFYLVWPVVVLLSQGPALIRTCLWLIALGFLARIGVTFDLVDHWSIKLLARLDLLALGALIACWINSSHPPDHKRGRLMARWLTGGAMMTLFLVILIAEGPWGDLMRTFGKLAVGALTAAVILSVVTRETPSPVLSQVFDSRFLRSWGKYSYAIYLLHSPLDAVLRRVIDVDAFFFPILGTELPMQVIYWILIGSISWVAGWLSWHMFELHFLKLKPLLTNSAKRQAPHLDNPA